MATNDDNDTDLYFLSLTKLTVLVLSQVRGSQSLHGTLEYRQEDTMPRPSSVVLDNFDINVERCSTVCGESPH